MSDNFLLKLIVACKIGFWILLLVGLCVRYLVKWPTVSAALLFCVPLADIILLAATALDLQRGSTTTFANGEAPQQVPQFGRELLRYEMILWSRSVLAAAITMALVFAAISFVKDRLWPEGDVCLV